MQTKLNAYSLVIIIFLLAGSFAALGAGSSANSFNVEDVARGAGLTFLAFTYYFAAFVVVQWQKSATRRDEK